MIFNSPLHISLERKTKEDYKIILNLNVFHNLNRFTYNNAKIVYNELMIKQMYRVKLPEHFALTFTLYRKDKRSGDRANVLSIHEKFFCDALQHWSCIDNDDDNTIIYSQYATSQVDKHNPRVEIKVTEVKMLKIEKTSVDTFTKLQSIFKDRDKDDHPKLKQSLWKELVSLELPWLKENRETISGFVFDRVEIYDTKFVFMNALFICNNISITIKNTPKKKRRK